MSRGTQGARGRVELPPLPGLHVRKILACRDQVRSIIEAMVWPIVGDHYERLVSQLSRKLKCPATPLHTSLLPILGRELTASEVLRLSWRIAANLDQLRAGHAVVAGAPLAAQMWAAVQIVGGDVVDGDLGWCYSLCGLTGPIAGDRLSTTWPKRVLRVMANSFGFTRKRYPFLHPDQLVSLRFAALLDPALGRDQFGFFHVSISSGLLTHNRNLLRLRYRSVSDCPRQFRHDCHHCHVGYQECPAATHRDTYIEVQ